MKKYLNKALLKRRLWLCLPAFITYALDVIATLFGQPANYWAGAYHEVNELNPISHQLLTIHPLLYIVYRIVTFGSISLLIVLLPVTLAKLLSTFLVLEHLIGANDWLKYVFHISRDVRVLLTWVVAILFTLALTQADKPVGQSVVSKGKPLKAKH